MATVRNSVIQALLEGQEKKCNNDGFRRNFPSNSSLKWSSERLVISWIWWFTHSYPDPRPPRCLPSLQTCNFSRDPKLNRHRRLPACNIKIEKLSRWWIPLSLTTPLCLPNLPSWDRNNSREHKINICAFSRRNEEEECRFFILLTNRHNFIYQHTWDEEFLILALDLFEDEGKKKTFKCLHWNSCHELWVIERQREITRTKVRAWVATSFWVVVVVCLHVNLRL